MLSQKNVFARLPGKAGENVAEKASGVDGQYLTAAISRLPRSVVS